MTLARISDPEAMRARARAARASGLRVGFVPTMGYLHEGHLSLLRRARACSGFVVASIFVNPAQFGPGEDFDRYPRDLERDASLLQRAEADVLFNPEVAAVYPAGHRTWVTVEGLSDVLCGVSRPGHFKGVATVVLKLMNVVEPDVAYFGQKDAQQAILIRTMARDLNLGIGVEVCPTVREADGLAMSSRNAYLSPPERAAAPVIHRALKSALDAVSAGERSARGVLQRARRVLDGEPLLRVEYVELISARDLSPLTDETLMDHLRSKEALLAVAGRIGVTRLIDNILLSADG